MDYSLGTSISMFISVLMSIVYITYDRREKKYDDEPKDERFSLIFLFFLVSLIFFVPIYSFINLIFLLVSGEYDLQKEIESSYILIRIVSIIIIYNFIIKKFFDENYYSKDYIETSHLNDSQSIIYLLSIFSMWLSLIYMIDTLVNNVLIFILLFIVDDWIIISGYMKNTIGFIEKTHRLRILLSNLLIFIMTIYLLYEVYISEKQIEITYINFILFFTLICIIVFNLKSLSIFSKIKNFEN